MSFKVITTVERTGKTGDGTFTIVLADETTLVCTTAYTEYPTDHFCLAPVHWPESVQDLARELHAELRQQNPNTTIDASAIIAWLVDWPKVGLENIAIELRYGTYNNVRELVIPGTITEFLTDQS